MAAGRTPSLSRSSPHHQFVIRQEDTQGVLNLVKRSEWNIDITRADCPEICAHQSDLICLKQTIHYFELGHVRRDNGSGTS